MGKIVAAINIKKPIATNNGHAKKYICSIITHTNFFMNRRVS